MALFKQTSFNNPHVIVFLIVIVVVAIISEISGERVIRSSYREICDNENRCDSRKSMACRNGICECLLPTSMIYDGVKEGCVVMAGEKCSFTAIEVKTDGEGENGREIQEKMWREEMPCVSGSKCLPNGFCVCDSTFIELKNGSCAPKGYNRHHCKSDLECREDLNLSCSDDGKCHCNPAHSTYHSLLDKCVSRAGQPCNQSHECPLDSNCIEPNEGTPKQCVCDDDYYPSKDGSCLQTVHYGERCDNEILCSKKRDLVCDNNVCRCNNQTVSAGVWGKCVIRAGAPCTILNRYYLRGKSCAPFSTCTRQNVLLSKCLCDSNYYQTINGTCEEKQGYHKKCNNNNQCQNDDEVKLRCISGICQCKDDWELVYDPIKKTCSTKSKHYCATGDKCVSNATCSPSSSRYGSGCVCDEGFIETKSGLCHGSYGTACSSDDNIAPCNSEAGFVCENKQCNCQFGDHQYFSEKQKRCLTLVKGPCGNSSIICTPNSECVDIGEDSKECQCQAGFVPVNRKCEIAYGQACDGATQKNVPCDRTGELKCINGVCSCGVYQMYDEKELRCRGLTGSVCDIGKENFCVDGAFCKQVRIFGPVKSGICQCNEKGFIRNKNRTCSAKEAELVYFNSSTTTTTTQSPSADKATDDDDNVMPKDEGYNLIVDNI